MARTSELTGPLLGRDRERSLLAVAASLGLFLGCFLLSAHAESQGWLHDWFARYPFIVLVVLVVGGAVAAGNAAWNDGLLVSWLLVFAPTLAWLWVVFVREGPVFVDEAAVPLAWATFTALVVGTVGYAAGLWLRRSTSEDGDEHASVSENWLFRALVGVGRLGRWAAVAAGLFVLVAGVTYATHPALLLPVEGVTLFELFYPTGVLVASPLFGALVVCGWLALAAWPAARGAGLLVSWGLLFGPFFGASLTDFVLGEISGSGPLVDAAFALLAALAFSLVLGTGGFLFGRCWRRYGPGATARD